MTPEQKEQAVVIRQAMLQARDEFRPGRTPQGEGHAAAMIEVYPARASIIWRLWMRRPCSRWQRTGSRPDGRRRLFRRRASY
ncbi:MAG: hypothetical protein ACLRPT_09880 [Akkermansia muciniphila]